MWVIKNISGSYQCFLLILSQGRFFSPLFSPLVCLLGININLNFIFIYLDSEFLYSYEAALQKCPLSSNKLNLFECGSDTIHQIMLASINNHSTHQNKEKCYPSMVVAASSI